MRHLKVDCGFPPEEPENRAIVEVRVGREARPHVQVRNAANFGRTHVRRDDTSWVVDVGSSRCYPKHQADGDFNVWGWV